MDPLIASGGHVERSRHAADIGNIELNVARYTSAALVWVNSSPSDRDPRSLPPYIASITRLIVDLRAIEMALPAQTFAPLHIHLTLVQDMLKAAQRTIDSLLGPLGCPQSKWRTWGTVQTGEIGRPAIACPEAMLKDLHRLGMNTRRQAEHLHVSRRTLYRWKKYLGLSIAAENELSPLQVQAEVDRCWKEGGGMEGYRLILAAFKRKEIAASRAQVRDAIRALDSDEARRRFAQTTTRRVYDVPFANSLWHIDGHHKLIDVKIVIHGGIDGKSRKVVFLKASTNNRAATVFESFQEAVRRFGIPSRVRGDYGKENLDVKRFMEAKRGIAHHAFIQGPSTRNQRIERFWLDLQWRCTFRYRMLFDSFKERGLLSVDNPFDIWCLHLCYLPMLNLSLQNTMIDWNGHKMDDLGGQSPDLMWWDSEQLAQTIYQLMKGVLDAEDRGIDIIGDPGMAGGSEVQEGLGNNLQRPLGFAEYGLDDYGRRADGQISSDDPLVEVQPVLGHIPPEIASYLEDEGLQATLLSRIGAWALGMDDWGEQRYVRCRAELDEILRSQFPSLLGLQ